MTYTSNHSRTFLYAEPLAFSPADARSPQSLRRSGVKKKYSPNSYSTAVQLVVVVLRLVVTRSLSSTCLYIHEHVLVVYLGYRQCHSCNCYILHYDHEQLYPSQIAPGKSKMNSTAVPKRSSTTRLTELTHKRFTKTKSSPVYQQRKSTLETMHRLRTTLLICLPTAPGCPYQTTGDLRPSCMRYTARDANRAVPGRLFCAHPVYL